MGHYVYITRKPDVLEDFGEAITHEEWNRYVATDPQIVHDTRNSPRDYLMKRSQGDCPLWWRDGEVSTKNPDDDALRKMARIAAAIGATVQGEAGELYDEEGCEIGPVGT